MNPSEHNVASVMIARVGLLSSALQIALPRTESVDPNDLSYYFSERIDTLNKIMSAAHRAIGDKALHYALLSQPPRTPNMVVIGIDHTSSTMRRENNETLLLREVDETTEAFTEALLPIDGAVAEYNGDGTNYVVPIPLGMRTSPEAIHTFMQDGIAPIIAPLRNPRIRIAMLAGYVTKNEYGADTGGVFWDVNKLLKSGQRH